MLKSVEAETNPNSAQVVYTAYRNPSICNASAFSNGDETDLLAKKLAQFSLRVS